MLRRYNGRFNPRQSHPLPWRSVSLERGCDRRYTRLMERLGLGHYLTDLAEPPGPYLYPLLAGVFALALVVAFYLLALQAEGRLPSGRFAAVARRASAPIGLSASLGLLSIAAAYHLTPFLSKRLWPVIALAGLSVALAMGLNASRAPTAAGPQPDPAPTVPAER
ncbi:MAG: hypothetical protein IT307_03405 [Chloroflexi bacterium]|nr:hypothetical protein [Chloroflexota bacterium]